MFMIGIDPHKGSHTAAVLDVDEQVVGELRVTASRRQRDELLGFAARFTPRRWAIEAAGGLGALLAQQLVAAGEQVVDVPPTLSARVRLLDAGRTDKTDPHDARSAAIVALRHSALRATRLPPNAKRWRATSSPMYAGSTTSSTPSKGRIATAVDASGTTVTDVYGVGSIVAAILIGHTGDVRRFPTAGHYARYNASAPIEASSGPRVRHRLNPRGNRQLNHALHVAAITQIRHDTPGRIYHQRKLAEGKSRKEALRALKRRISDAVYRQMLADTHR